MLSTWVGEPGGRSPSADGPELPLATERDAHPARQWTWDPRVTGQPLPQSPVTTFRGRAPRDHCWASRPMCPGGARLLRLGSMRVRSGRSCLVALSLSQETSPLSCQSHDSGWEAPTSSISSPPTARPDSANRSLALRPRRQLRWRLAGAQVLVMVVTTRV